ncbi:MAG: CAP domain-containing protein [Myxococcota bacterium]|nr:CAP domain-containing protein [Myxococcota bacterium]
MRSVSRVLGLVPLVLLVSCAGSLPPDSDSGCQATSVDLTEELTSSSAEALLQLNCYRQRMNGTPAQISPALSEAAQLHAEYLEATGAWGHGEDDPSIPSYRGATPGERATAAGFPIDDNLQSITELVGFHSDGADASDAVDLWFNTVYHRLPLATPQLEAVGFGQAGIYDVMLVVSPWEASADGPDFLVHGYPAAGQAGVPTSFDSDREVPDPTPDRGEVGFPISLTFLDQGFHQPDNLYGLTVDENTSVLRGPDGNPIETLLLTPSTDALIRRSAVLLPVEPLLPKTSYEVRLQGTVGESPFEEFWSFETGD